MLSESTAQVWEDPAPILTTLTDDELSDDGTMNPEEATSLLKDSLSASSVQDTSKTTIKMRNNFRGILENKSKPKLIL